MIQKFLTMLVVLMMLVPSVIAAPSEKTNTKDLKINDQSKGQMTEIKDDKVKGLKSSSSDIVVEEKGKNNIKLKDPKPSKDKKEHKKVKVSIPTTELDKIDIDNDGKFGILETADGVVIDQYTATSAQLTAGIDMMFSEVEINGFTGYRSEIFNGVTTGDILDTVDVSGNYTRTAAVTGTIPAYVPIVETSISTYPASVYTVFPLNDNGNSLTGISGTQTNVSFASGQYASYNGIDSISSYSTGITGLSIASNQSIHAKAKVNAFGASSRWIVGKYTGGTPGSGYLLSAETSGNTRWAFRTDNLSAYSYSYTAATRLFSDSTVHDVVICTDTFNKILHTYVDGKLLSSMSYTGNIAPTTPLRFGSSGTVFTNMQLYTVGYYNSILTAGQVAAISSNGYGIQFNTFGDNNWIPYNVSTGTEKVIASNGASTQVKFMDSSVATRTVTIKTYYTEDTTISTETSTDDFYNTSVVFSPSVALTNGTIARPIAPLYTGTAVLDSNNTNAVMTQNRTHYTIYTGTLTAGSWAGYNVSVPNNADHGMWLDRLMQWVSGVGWNFVGTAPTDYTDDISDEITVTVS